MEVNQRATEEKVYGGEQDAPECPPVSEFTLMLLGVKSIGLGKSFDGKEPQEQLTLEFKIDAETPAPGSLQDEWHHLDLIGWYTPILHYGPDLPDFAGNRYTEPKLYKLARAINGGTPIAMPTAVNDKGRMYFVPYTARQAAERLEAFFGHRFRSVVGPNASNWPRLQGDPMPLIAAGTRRRGAQAQATLPTAPPNGADEPDPFVGDDL